MAAGFGALGDKNVGAGFRSAHRFGNFPGHVHDRVTGIVGALKIVAQVLVSSRPCKGGDPWPSAQCDREHIFLDLKQQMIDAEWFIGALADRGDLGLERRSVEGRSAEGPKPPALDTAATNGAVVAVPMPPRTIGCRIPSRSQIPV